MKKSNRSFHSLRKVTKYLGSHWVSKKFFFVLLTSLILASFQHAKAQTPKNILFINPGYKDKGFWKAVTETMQAASDSFGYNLDVVYGDRGWPIMLSRGTKAIEENNPDYIILVNEHQQAPKLMALAEHKNIPILLLLNSLTEEQEKTFGKPREGFKNWLGSIVPDNEIAGFEMAQSLVEGQRKKNQPNKETIHMLTLAGDFQTPASIHRLLGLDRALRTFNTLKEKRRITVNWSSQEAYERTQRWIENKPLDAVWAANDPIAVGAIKAIREASLIPGKDVLITGLNWSTTAVELVHKGEMTLTHGGHFLAGAWSIVLLHDYDHGRDFSDLGNHIKFPMTAINSRNAEKYLKEFGDGNWSKIDFTHFSRRNNQDFYQFTLQNIFNSLN